MFIDKMREQFEVWALTEGLSLNTRYGAYVLAPTEKAWRAWKASRDVSTVELPPPEYFGDSWSGGWAITRENIVDALEAQGLKVKP